MALIRTVPHVSTPVWGGTRLAAGWGKSGAVGGRIGETWEVWRDNPVVGSPGTRLAEILDFPLLVKLLDTREVLSVQVHPSDADARRLVDLPSGKAEAWVVLEAEPGARVAYGLNRSMSVAELRANAESGAIEGDLAWIPVRVGDVIPVPPGTIHAIGPGILLYEVQQPADVTWRLYDWGRGRPLHLDLALQVALRAPALPLPVASVVTPGMTRLVDDRAFLLDRVDVPGATVVPGLRALTVIAGRVEIDGEGFSRGETAIGRDVRVTGAGSLLAAGVAAVAGG